MSIHNALPFHYEPDREQQQQHQPSNNKPIDIDPDVPAMTIHNALPFHYEPDREQQQHQHSNNKPIDIDPDVRAHLLQCCDEALYYAAAGADDDVAVFTGLQGEKVCQQATEMIAQVLGGGEVPSSYLSDTGVLFFLASPSPSEEQHHYDDADHDGTTRVASTATATATTTVTTTKNKQLGIEEQAFEKNKLWHDPLRAGRPPGGV
jgi:hypothetical protein